MTTGYAEAAQQIAGQREIAGGGPLAAASDQQLGQAALDAGAGATSVDANELLAYIRGLEARVEAVEAERQAERDAGKPDLVTMAEILSQHIAHRASALGKGGVLDPFIAKGQALVDAAKRAAESGDGSEVSSMLGSLAAGLTRIAGAAASADVSYPIQLAAETLPEIVSALKAHPKATAQVLSRTDAPPRRGLAYQPVR
jgi:hypothetical protein